MKHLLLFSFLCLGALSSYAQHLSPTPFDDYRMDNTAPTHDVTILFIDPNPVEDHPDYSVNDSDGNTSTIDHAKTAVQARPILADVQHFPNPAINQLNITFQLLETQPITLVIFNCFGQKITRLSKGTLLAGQQEITFDTSQLVTGMYFYRLQFVGGNVDGQFVK